MVVVLLAPRLGDREELGGVAVVDSLLPPLPPRSHEATSGSLSDKFSFIAPPLSFVSTSACSFLSSALLMLWTCAVVEPAS